MKPQILKITHVSSSSRRTRTRLREHGPEFIILLHGRPVCFEGQSCVLVESTTTHWQGWLPLKEIANAT